MGNIIKACSRLHQVLAKHGKNTGEKICNLFFPPQCMACYTPVTTHGALCTTCWNDMEYITPPQCVICGTPFDYKIEGTLHCGQCTISPPPFTMARAVCRYNNVSSRLVSGLKYSDKTYLAPYLGKWLAQAGREFLHEADIVTPVPLHPYRLFKRRYNQSALLAREITRSHPSLTLILPLLKRKRNTPPQAGLTHRQRQSNVKGAFTLHKHYREHIKDKHIILVDDVMTTGATIRACANTLLRGGARRVDVLTLGQTLK